MTTRGPDVNIKDFILLGRTVACASEKYGYCMCSAGWSDYLEDFIRVYPLHIENGWQQWCKYSIRVYKTSRDKRFESFHIEPEFAPVRVTTQKTVSTKMRYAVLNRVLQYSDDSITSIIATGRSLGIVIPKRIVCAELAERDVDDDFGERSVPFKPYIKFEDASGKSPRIQLREIGAYEWCRKHPGVRNADKLWDNLRLGDPDYRHAFLVGNMTPRRQHWLIIACYPIKMETAAKHGLQEVHAFRRLESQTGFATCSR